jgi:hypothetical protein
MMIRILVFWCVMLWSVAAFAQNQDFTNLNVSGKLALTGITTSGGSQILVIDTSSGDVIRRVLGKSDLPSAVAYEDEANTFSSLQTLSSGLTLAGNLTASSGTLPIVGNVTTSGALFSRGDVPIIASGVDEVRLGKRTSFNWPTILLEDAGFMQWNVDNVAGQLRMYRRNTAGDVIDDPLIPLTIDGNITIGPYGKRLLPSTPYGVDIGSQQMKFGALWTGDLYADRLVTIENIGTVDNRWLIGSGNVLDEDLAPAGTSMVTRYNNYATGTFVYLQKFARTEFIKTSSGPTLTNKVANGSFETGATTNWSGTTATISASTTKAFHGETSMLVDATSGTSFASYSAFSFVTSTTYTVCFNARRVDGATMADGAVAIFMRDSYVDAVAQQTATDGWARFCRTAAAGADSTAVLVIATKGVDMYLDAIQVEETATQRVYSEYRASYSIARNQEGTGQANQWYAGDGMMSVGAVTGDGWLDCYAIRGTKSATEIGPACVANVRIGSSYNDWTPFAAWGNLNGLYGISGTRWGFRAGYEALTTLGADTVEGFTIKSNGVMKMQFDTSGNGFLAGSLSVTNNITMGSGGSLIGGNFKINTTGLEVPVTNTATLDPAFAYKWTGSSRGGSMFIQGYDFSTFSRNLNITNDVTSNNQAVISIRATSNTSTQVASVGVLASGSAGSNASVVSLTAGGLIIQYQHNTPTGAYYFGPTSGADNAIDLGVNGARWKQLWITPSNITAGASVSNPLVVSTTGEVSAFTSGFTGTCTTTIVVFKGLITGC